MQTPAEDPSYRFQRELAARIAASFAESRCQTHVSSHFNDSGQVVTVMKIVGEGVAGELRLVSEHGSPHIVHTGGGPGRVLRRALRAIRSRARR